MADEYQKPTHGYNSNVHETESEIKDRGMFDFLSKKKQSSEEKCKPVEEPAEHDHHKFGHEECKPEVEELTNEVEHVYISEPSCEEEEKKKPCLLEKLHRSHSNSSSSSSSDEEEEVMEDGVMVKRKKKKSLKDKLKEKLHKKEEEKKKKEHCEDTSVPIEKCDAVHEGEKKGLLEKLKEKLPGKKCEEDKAPVEPVHVSSYESHHEVKEEKKGFLEKIKEKFSKNDDECKEKEKDHKETPADASHH